jgi:hypothetical protein
MFQNTMRTILQGGLLASALLFTLGASAQNATISRFRFTTADTAYSIWGDSTTVFRYTGPDRSMRSTRTADTLFSYTQATLERRLRIKLEEQHVDSTPDERSKEKLTGFPNRKLKEVRADALFGYIVEVDVVVYRVFEPVKDKRRKGQFDKKVEMQVTVETYDGAGNQTAKYKARTAAKDTNKRSWANGLDPKVGVTGTQLFDLYTVALENAMNDTP